MAAAFDAPALGERGLCTGCGLCAGVSGGALEMRINRAGFLRPAAVPGRSLDAATAEALARACPAVTMRTTAGADDAVHPLWGVVRRTATGHATDPTLRQAGSSGGALTALADGLLASGRVQAVAQIVADPADPLGNRLQLATDRGALLAAAGSRYAPSAPLAPLFEALEAFGDQARIAFIGKPCDVAALRQWLRERPALAPRVPVLLSFFCAGVPSRQASERLLDAMGAPREQVVALRYRGDGWPGLARATLADGTHRSMDYASSWGRILGRELQLRCKICPDGTGEFADLVAADAWYGDDGYPEFDERPGRSLLLARTAAGEALLHEATEAGVMAVEPLPLAEVERMQPYQATRRRMLLARWLGVRLRLGAAPRYRGLALWPAARQARPLAWLRQAWGSFRRAAREA